MEKDNVSIFAEPIWAIVELMGRNIIAGLIQSVPAAGTELLRVDVPTVNSINGFTKFYGGAAIYAITPTDEESVRHEIESTKPRAISEWTIPTRIIRALPPSELYEPLDDGEDDDWNRVNDLELESDSEDDDFDENDGPF